MIGKGKWNEETKNEYDKLLNKISIKKRKNERIIKIYAYSFCKSHSYSEVQLVYKIAYQKAHNPYKFWKSKTKIVVVQIENGCIYRSKKKWCKSNEFVKKK